MNHGPTVIPPGFTPKRCVPPLASVELPNLIALGASFPPQFRTAFPFLSTVAWCALCLPPPVTSAKCATLAVLHIGASSFEGPRLGGVTHGLVNAVSFGVLARLTVGGLVYTITGFGRLTRANVSTAPSLSASKSGVSRCHPSISPGVLGIEALRNDQKILWKSQCVSSQLRLHLTFAFHRFPNKQPTETSLTGDRTRPVIR